MRAGWTPPERLSGPVAVAPARVGEGAPQHVDFVLRHRLDLPLALVRCGARRDPAALIAAARACGVPYAYALGRRRVRELELPPLGAAGPARERELERVPSPKELWRRYKKRLCLTSAGARLLKASLPRGSGPRVAEGPCAAAERRMLEALALGRRRASCILPEGLDRPAVAARIARRLGVASRADGGRLPRTLVVTPDRARQLELRAAFAPGADELLVLATPDDVELRARPPVARLERGAFDLILIEGDFGATAWSALEAVLERDERALQLAFLPGGPDDVRARAAARFGAPLVDAGPVGGHGTDDPVGDAATTHDAERLLDDLERATRRIEDDLVHGHAAERAGDAERVRAAFTREELIERWPSPRTRERLLARLSAAGLDLTALAARAGARDASAADGLDLLLHVGWDEPLVTRRERADRLRRRAPRVWRAADDRERALLGLALEQYVAHGLAEPWLPGRLDARALRALGGARALEVFGEPRRLRKALRRLARALVPGSSARSASSSGSAR